MAGNIFINHSENRLRAFWRLIIQGGIFLGIIIIGSIPIGILAGVLLAALGGNFRDPQAILAATGHPLLHAGSALLSLLAIFISYWVAARWLDRRPFRDFGFHLTRRWWADFGFGLLLGAVLMAIIFAVELATGWITITGFWHSFREDASFLASILAYVVVYFCVGIYEEMFSRGYQLRNLAEGLNFKVIGPRGALLIAYLFSSSIFGLLHLGNPNATAVSTLNLVVAGLFLGLGYVLTGELAVPIGLHMTWNFFQGNVFGFPVSGTSTAASLIAIQQRGPDLWTGGAFGPEAGLIGLAAILLGSLLIILWVRWRYGQARLHDSLAIYQPAIRQIQEPSGLIPGEE